jgi:polyisoprenoid-binding protein YceI
MKSARAVFTLTIALFTAQAFAADTYVVDKPHSNVQFKIRHLVSNVTGKFKDFTGTARLDKEAPGASAIEFSIKSASIDTAADNRDQHLRSADFFEVEKYPEITFKSTKIAASGSANVYDVTGNFTLHGVTKQITLPVTFLGFAKNAWGKEIAGFELETTLDRKEYGIVWNKVLDTGGLMLGDDVKVTIALELVKQ